MTEQETTKKPSLASKLFKRSVLCLRWLFGFIFTALTLAGLYFQVPWLVLLFLVWIMLSSFNIISKTTDNLIAYILIALSIVIAIWCFVPEKDDDQWKPYTLDKELAELEVARSVPADQNAAVVYTKLIEENGEDYFNPNFLDYEASEFVENHFWKKTNHSELYKWIDARQDTIDLLVNTSKLDFCRLPLEASAYDIVSQHFDYRHIIKRFFELLLISANNDVSQGNTNSAIEKYCAALEIARHASQQPTMLDMLMGINAKRTVARQFNRLVVASDLSTENLDFIDKTLTETQMDWKSDWLNALVGDNLIFKNTICGTLYEKNDTGKFRNYIDMDILATPHNPSPFKNKKALRVASWCLFPHSPEIISQIVDKRFEKYYAIAEPDFDWNSIEEPPMLKPLVLNYKLFVRLMLCIMEPNFESIHEVHLRSNAFKNCNKIIIELRQLKNVNGKWPESLDVLKGKIPDELLTDPINGCQYTYKLINGNFLLYSIGKNKIDEDGDNWTKKGDGTRTDDIMIWPNKCECCKKENKLKGEQNEKAVSIEE